VGLRRSSICEKKTMNNITKVLHESNTKVDAFMNGEWPNGPRIRIHAVCMCACMG
jgi:hypothetical protein